MNIDVKGYEGRELAIFMNGYMAGREDFKKTIVDNLEKIDVMECDDCNSCPFEADTNEDCCPIWRVRQWIKRK